MSIDSPAAGPCNSPHGLGTARPTRRRRRRSSWGSNGVDVARSHPRLLRRCVDQPHGPFPGESGALPDTVDYPLLRRCSLFSRGQAPIWRAPGNRSRGELAAFLATRGVWLIFLELTVVRLGLFFDPISAPVILTVLWSIGASFVVLSGLVFLPSRLVGALGVLLIATHGLAGGFPPGDDTPVALRAAKRYCFDPDSCRCPPA